MDKYEFSLAHEKISKTINDAKLAISDKSFHAFFTSIREGDLMARTYELTVIKKEKSLVGILSEKAHQLAEDMPSYFFFERNSSSFGLPFVLIERSSDVPTSLDLPSIRYMRDYLLRGSQIRLKTSMLQENWLRGTQEWIYDANEASRGLTKAVDPIIETFKGSRAKARNYITGSSFSTLKNNSVYSRSLGIPVSKYEEFISAYKESLMGPVYLENKVVLDKYFQISDFAFPDWRTNQIVYGLGGSESSCNSLVITNQIDTNENVVHFLTVKLSGVLSIGPKALLYVQYKNIFGSFNIPTKTFETDVPQGVASGALTGIKELMRLNAINVLAAKAEVKFQFSNDDPWKI